MRSLLALLLLLLAATGCQQEVEFPVTMVVTEAPADPAPSTTAPDLTAPADPLAVLEHQRPNGSSGRARSCTSS